MRNTAIQKTYKEAKRKVKAIKGFYFNLLIYIVTHVILIYFSIIYNLQFTWFWYSAVLWGVGMVAYGILVFNGTIFIKKNWEEHKLKELIGNKDVNEENSNNAEELLNEKILYNRAKKRVRALRNFYIHLTAYVLIIVLMLILLWAGYQTRQDLFIYIAYGTALGWSIGLVIHTFKVFGISLFMGKSWEKQKLTKLIEEENKDKI